MNLMPDVDRVIDWLLRALDLAEVTEVWLYGSFVRRAPGTQDVDVMVRFKDGWVDHAARLRRKIESDFEREFDLPMHAIFLSDNEFRAEAKHLAVVLSEARCLRYLGRPNANAV